MSHTRGTPTGKGPSGKGRARGTGASPAATGGRDAPLAQFFGVLKPTTLTTGDLVLRPLEPGDEAGVSEAMRDSDVLRWAAGRTVVAAPEPDRGRIWLNARMGAWSSGTAPFAVTDGEGGPLLGYVGLRDIHRVPDQAVAAYWVTPAARGRGVAARALDAAASWAFTSLRVHRISLDHALDNHASCRTAEKAGFRAEGTMRESFLAPDGRRHDSHLHARLATDPEPS